MRALLTLVVFLFSPMAAQAALLTVRCVGPEMMSKEIKKFYFEFDKTSEKIIWGDKPENLRSQKIDRNHIEFVAEYSLTLNGIVKKFKFDFSIGRNDGVVPLRTLEQLATTTSPCMKATKFIARM